MKSKRIRPHRLPPMKRRGVTAVMFIILLPVLLLFIGFSVDLAYMQLSRSELRAATDLAAKAASAELARTGSVSAAIAKGKLIANTNRVAGEGLSLEDSDFVFGNTIRSATGKWAFTENASPMNAVRVNGRRTAAAPDGEVELFFSDLFDGGGFPSTATATAGFINADICLVLDRSSSMKLAVSDTSITMSDGDPRVCDIPWTDSRWIALDDAIRIFLDKMNNTLAKEHISIVTFASNYEMCGSNSQSATLDQPLTSDTANITLAMEKLSSTIWNGMTETSEGMSLARTELTGSNARPTAQKVMIVLTDGAYTNATHPAVVASGAASDNIRVHTITFGSCPTSVISDLKTTADAGGGYHFHAPDASTLNDAFSRIAGSLSILTQ
ncbi:VWA domain-containing protein [Neorhodopirellula lusitana]|nr:VWA domain-containing protein [Neorhodopirellula lusitana]